MVGSGGTVVLNRGPAPSVRFQTTARHGTARRDARAVGVGLRLHPIDHQSTTHLLTRPRARLRSPGRRLGLGRRTCRPARRGAFFLVAAAWGGGDPPPSGLPVAVLLRPRHIKPRAGPGRGRSAGVPGGSRKAGPGPWCVASSRPDSRAVPVAVTPRHAPARAG